jgi:hypothetical protein
MSTSADNNEYIRLHLKLLESRFRTAKGSLEILTVFKQPNLKSAACMIEDAELLLDAAMELHQAMVKGEKLSPLETPPQANLFYLPPRTTGRRQSDDQPAQKVEDRQATVKSEVEFTFKEAAPSAGGRGAYIPSIVEPDWLALREVKRTKLYKGMQFIASGESITLKTFNDYCNLVIGLSARMVREYLKHLDALGGELFLALRGLGMGIKKMSDCRTLTAEQKRELLQVAQTGSSVKAARAAVQAFVRQALQAGE